MSDRCPSVPAEVTSSPAAAAGGAGSLYGLNYVSRKAKSRAKVGLFTGETLKASRITRCERKWSIAELGKMT